MTKIRGFSGASEGYLILPFIFIDLFIPTVLSEKAIYLFKLYHKEFINTY